MQKKRNWFPSWPMSMNVPAPFLRRLFSLVCVFWQVLNKSSSHLSFLSSSLIMLYVNYLYCVRSIGHLGHRSTRSGHFSV